MTLSAEDNEIKKKKTKCMCLKQRYKTKTFRFLPIKNAIECRFMISISYYKREEFQSLKMVT